MTSISLMVVGMALINLVIRWPVYLFANRIRFPAVIERALTFVPVAVLTAIVVPTVLYPDGNAMQLDWRNPYLSAALFTAVIGRVTKNLFATIVLGMLSFLVLRSAL